MIIWLNFWLIHIININNIPLMTLDHIDMGLINTRNRFSTYFLSKMSHLMSSSPFNRLNYTYYAMLDFGIWSKVQWDGAVVAVIVYYLDLNYLCIECLSSLILWVGNPLRRGAIDTTLCEKVGQWLATGGGFLHVNLFPPPIKLTAMI